MKIGQSNTELLERNLLYVSVAFGAVFLAAFLHAVWANLPVELGNNIPSPDLIDDYYWAGFVTACFALVILILPASKLEKFSLLAVWMFKSIASLWMGLFFEDRYSFHDAFTYFLWGQFPDWSLADADFGEGTILIVWLSSLLQEYLPGEYHTLKQAFSFIGLLGIWVALWGVRLVLGSRSYLFVLCCGLTPSVSFWLSAIGKDVVVFFMICTYLSALTNLYFRWSNFWAALIVIAIVGAAAIRLWMGVILMLPACYLLGQRLKSPAAKVGLVLIALVGSIYFSIMLGERFDFRSQGETLEAVDRLAKQWADDGGSGQRVTADLTNPATLVLFYPWASFTALFRPLPGEILNLFGTLSGLENLLLLCLAIWSIRRWKLGFTFRALALTLLFVLLVWLVFYAPMSYQNLGTAVRYRAQIMPVVFLLFLMLSGAATRGSHAK